MANRSQKTIISVAAGVALALFAAFTLVLVLRRPQTESDPDPERDMVDYPPIRAHVYFASQNEVLDALKAAIDAVSGAGIVAAPDGGVRIQLSSPSEATQWLQAVLQPLGPSHIRAVIFPVSGTKLTSSTETAIKQLQQSMDKALIGG